MRGDPPRVANASRAAPSLGRGDRLLGPIPALVAGILVASAAPASFAQGVRGDVRVVGSYIEYRGVQRVSLPDSLVPGTGTTRVTQDGTVWTCVPGIECTTYRASEAESGTPITQELRVTAWPGSRGWSARLNLRTRYGSDGFWPGSSRKAEALDAHIAYENDRVRARAGRLERFGGLGVHHLDGASLLWKSLDAFRVEGFAGRSRARIVNEPYTGDLLAESDALHPDSESVLWGLEAWLRAGRLTASAMYQRDQRTDGKGLYSERAALDARWNPGMVTLDLSTDFDWALLDFNDVRLAALGALRSDLQGVAEFRHYRPFFELWTLWGAFTPVAYNEGRTALRWSPGTRWRLEGQLAYRDYEDASAGAEFLPVEGDGWRALLSAARSLSAWSLSGTYSYLRGPGAERLSLDLDAGRSFGAAHLGAFLVGSQRFLEFRFGEGATAGAGAEARLALESVEIQSTLGLYRHAFDRPGFEDYTQLRARLSAVWTFGSEPAARPTGFGRARQ